jgi:hypothetical protein
MKRICLISTILGLVIIVAFSAFRSPAVPRQTQQQVFFNYCWFTDPYLSNPTGRWGEVATEIARLSGRYPGYTFTNQSSPSLVEFEYGYFPNHPVVIIYSNLDPSLAATYQ